MTDFALIKALENKVNGSDYTYFEDYEILALIKRQQTEINKLERARQKQGNFLVELRQQKYELMNRMPLVKNEAYKEFANKVKQELMPYDLGAFSAVRAVLKDLTGEDTNDLQIL